MDYRDDVRIRLICYCIDILLKLYISVFLGEALTSTAKKAAKDKPQFVLDFDAEIDFDKKSKKTRAATTVTKSTLDR